MDEKGAFDKVIYTLKEHHLRRGRDYIIEHYNKGCFYIRFCPKQATILDVQYFYERIPDITIFKIKYSRDAMYLNLKIRIRE